MERIDLKGMTFFKKAMLSNIMSKEACGPYTLLKARVKKGVVSWRIEVNHSGVLKEISGSTPLSELH